jgi:hypothetical protein
MEQLYFDWISEATVKDAAAAAAGSDCREPETALTLDLCSATRWTIFNGLYLANLEVFNEKCEDSAIVRRKVLFVIATDSYRNGTFVRVNKNKNVRAIQVNFVVYAERENDVTNCCVDLRTMDFIVETAVEDNSITAKTKV